VRHLTTTATDLKSALHASGRDALVVALQRASATMTSTEKNAVCSSVLDDAVRS